MKPFVITIARRYGSGGKTVGRMLAKELNIPFYDREIIAMASEDSGVNEVLFSDERLRPDLRSRLRGLYKGEPVLGYSTPAKGAPRDGELFEYQALSLIHISIPLVFMKSLLQRRKLRD